MNMENQSPAIDTIWRKAWNWLREPLAIGAFVLLSNTAIAQTFYVPSGSMEPTLAIGDALIASKFAYGYSRYSLPFGLGPSSESRLLERLPARGDVVVFRLPRDTSVTYVKRVVGLPGDKIQMRDGHLVINGTALPLKEDGAALVENSDGSSMQTGKFIETLPGGHQHPIFKHQWNGTLDNTDEYVVPKDHVFVMGDNRDDSWDSRVPIAMGGVGFVPMENLMARAEVVIGSYDFLRANAISNWLGQIRWSRFFHRIG
jgi:signal peptidase I